MEENNRESRQFLLEHQNRSLSLELMRNKRSIAETRKELEFLRSKHREMESLVSLIQRAWSQLDIDASLMLDCLGDFEISQNPDELLHNMLTINNNFLQIDPQSIKIPQLDVDEWSSNKEIQEATASTEQVLAEEISPGSTTAANPITPRTPGTKKKRQAHNAQQQQQQQQQSNNNPSAMEVTTDQPKEDSQGQEREVSDEQLRSYFEHNVDQRMLDHVSFTLSLLEKLCNAINEGGNNPSNTQFSQPPLVAALTNAREHAAKIHVLTDAINKLRYEIVTLENKYHVLENEKSKTERRLDKVLLTVKELEGTIANHSSSSNTTTTSSSSSSTNNNTTSSTDPTTTNNNNNEYVRQIALLEGQLIESEAAKAQAEMALTERLSRPLHQSEAQISDLRKAMEDLRFQCKQRISLLITENEMLQDKVKDLTLALQLVEKTATQKISEVITECDKIVTKITLEKTAIENKLSTCQAEIASIEAMKAQIMKYQSLEEVRNNKIRQLEQQVEYLNHTIVKQNQAMDSLHHREVQLIRLVKSLAKKMNNTNSNTNDSEDMMEDDKEEEELEGKRKKQQQEEEEEVLLQGILNTPDTTINTIPSTTATNNNSNNNSSDVNHDNTTNTNTIANNNELEEGEDGEILSPAPSPPPVPPPLPTLPTLPPLPPTHSDELLQLAEDKITFLQQELHMNEKSLHDLILEIETIAQEENHSRLTAESVLKQVTESQYMQQAALEENLKLTNQLEEMKEEKILREKKYDVMKGTMITQDQIITELKTEKLTFITNQLELMKQIKEFTKCKQSQELMKEELNQNITDKEREVNNMKEKEKELLQRCHELTKQCQQERKLRLEQQKVASQLQAKQKQAQQTAKDHSEAAAAAASAEALSSSSSGAADMLEMTLNMLRCSVCKDRFKSVCIKKCFHLFCKECIDENIRNRSRKCPACGEKFGQDDVATVYFTH